MPRLLSEWTMQRDDVAFREELIHGYVDQPVRGFLVRLTVGVTIQNTHPEAGGSSDDCTPDPAKPDQPECGAVNILAQERLRAPGFPVARLDVLLALHHAPRRGEHQRDGKIG